MPIIESYLNSNDVSGCTDIITGLSTVLPINVITILISKTIGYSGMVHTTQTVCSPYMNTWLITECFGILKDKSIKIRMLSYVCDVSICLL